MFELADLYQEIILDHSRHPRNFGPLPGANRAAEGYNPLCGDRTAVRLKVEDGVIEDIAFEGAGCAISTASASVLTEAVRGKTVAEAEALFDRLIDMLTGGPEHAELVAADPELGSVAAFVGVSAYPSRVKCATLAWHALHRALGEGEIGDASVGRFPLTSPQASPLPPAPSPKKAGGGGEMPGEGGLRT